MTGRVLSWRDLPRPVRSLGFWLAVVQAVGYTTSLVFVWWTTRLRPTGIAVHYRGADPATSEGAMEFGKSFAEMLTITHTHMLAMAVIFALSGASFALIDRVSERWRRVVVVEPFIALLVSFTAMWLMRYVHPGYSVLLAASSGLMALTFYYQTWHILRELWLLRGVP